MGHVAEAVAPCFLAPFAIQGACTDRSSRPEYRP